MKRNLFGVLAGLCLTMTSLGAMSAEAEEEGFVWDGMHSRFATDLSQTAEQCRVAAARVALDPFTNKLGYEMCPELQRMVNNDECDPVDYDLRGHRHHLMGFQHNGQTAVKPGALVRLPWKPTALICEFGKTDDYVFVATVYVGTQPNGEQACYNVAIDFIPVPVIEAEAIPVSVTHVRGVSSSTVLPQDIYLGKCVPNMVHYIINRRRY